MERTSMRFFYPFQRRLSERLQRIDQTLGFILETLETIAMSFEDLKAAQDATEAKIDAVKADIDALMAKLAAIPVPGMTPEQEAALADAVAHAQAINDRLGAIDAMNP